MSNVFAKREQGLSQDCQFVEVPPFPRCMMFELNNSCNHKCSFCYHNEMQRPRRVMDFEFAERMIRDGYRLGARECGLATTGEPLINPYLFDIIRIAKDTGYDYVYFSSNGAALSEEKVHRIIESGVDSVKFSINAGTSESYKAIHGSDKFDHVVNMIKYLHSARDGSASPLILVSCVVTPETKGEEELLKRVLGKHVDDILVVDALPKIGPINVGNIKLPCSLPFKRVHITSEGYLTACCTDFENNLIVGNLNVTSLEDAWGGADYIALRRKHLDRNVKGTLCNLCITHKAGTPYEPLPIRGEE